MFDKPINFKKLHKALSDTYKRQMDIKKEYPFRYEVAPWSLWEVDKGATLAEERKRRVPWAAARREFDELSYRMTILCCILNHAKGKLHMQKLIDRDNSPYAFDAEPMTLEVQAALVDGYWEEFAVTDDTDSFGVSETDEALVEAYLTESAAPKKKGLVSRFVEALGL